MYLSSQKVFTYIFYNRDVGVLNFTAEIARLQNSLSHLKSTQEQLKEANDECPDPEFEQAIKENENVMCVLSPLNLVRFFDQA